MWSYFDPLELLIETGAGHKYPLSIGLVFVVVKFHLGSNQTSGPEELPFRVCWEVQCLRRAIGTSV